jgi:protease IV
MSLCAVRAIEMKRLRFCCESPRHTRKVRLLLVMFLLVVFNGCTLFKINVTPSLGPLKEKTVSGEGGDKVLLIDIKGVISNKKEVSALGVVMNVGLVDRVRETLKKAEKDDAVKALILRINTPGGTVTSSDIIYHEIKTFKERKKIKVYAVVMDLAASGGYYVAQAADRIIVHPTSLTGSIGVIAMKMNLSGLMDKMGVGFEVVKSGDHKDFLSPFRALTKDERLIFQETIDNLHQRFVSTIEENRKQLNRDEIKKLSDGRIYTSQQALDAKLIDQIAYMDEAEEFIKKDLGLDEMRLVIYHRAGQYKSNIYSSPPVPPAINFNFVNLNFIPETPGPNFLYLWMP